MKIPQDAIDPLLDDWPVARLATTGPDGRPHLVPIVFFRDGDLIFSAVDGKPKSGGELARVRNVERCPGVSLLLDDYSPDWSRLWWLRIDGMASVLRPEAGEADPEVARARRGLRRKYPQYQETPLLADPPTLLRVQITAIQGWCASPRALRDRPRV
jgi:PPOX class probable F420-dependent enzyme